MVSSLRDVAYLLARKTADEYRNKGYKVSLDMPLDFLPGFRADVVVSKDGETKVIEVKSRSSLGANPKIVELARIIDTKPGWSFDLVLVAEPEIVDSPQGAHPFKDEAILQRIEEAENTLAAGFSQAAFLLAWSACEASLRDLVAEEDISDSQITRPDYVLKQAVFQGLLSHDDYDSLTTMRKYRNAIVHGFSVDDFGNELTTGLINVAKRIMAAKTQGADDSAPE